VQRVHVSNLAVARFALSQSVQRHEPDPADEVPGGGEAEVAGDEQPAVMGAVAVAADQFERRFPVSIRETTGV